MLDLIVNPVNGSLHNINSDEGKKIIMGYKQALSNKSVRGGQRQKKTPLKRLDTDLQKHGIGNKRSSPRPKHNSIQNKKSAQKSNKKVTKKVTKKSNKKSAQKSNKKTNNSTNKGNYDNIRTGETVTFKNGACAVKKENGQFKFIKKNKCK